MECFLGQIFHWPMNWAPYQFAICNGQRLAISEYQALFSLLHFTYGGDNSTYFCLPDLRGRAPIGYGHAAGLYDYQYGQPYGGEGVQLSIANLAKHTHSGTVALAGGGKMRASGDDATLSVPNPTSVPGKANTTALDAGSGPATMNIYRDATNLIDMQNAIHMNMSGGGDFETSAAGNGTQFPIVSPVLTMNYIMCIEGGEYPLRP